MEVGVVLPDHGNGYECTCCGRCADRAPAFSPLVRAVAMLVVIGLLALLFFLRAPWRVPYGLACPVLILLVNAWILQPEKLVARSPRVTGSR